MIIKKYSKDGKAIGNNSQTPIQPKSKSHVVSSFMLYGGICIYNKNGIFCLKTNVLLKFMLYVVILKGGFDCNIEIILSRCSPCDWHTPKRVIKKWSLAGMVNFTLC